ncbi:endo-1,4-beta-xylanase [Streptomyces sp. t39]|uniref:endo-1,4-beta-xylanase n=1 Tax=Streptomyces sp. t39 TaxID=1828156 RepID=UPI0011CEAEB9|nr:endo-1,4-beta-xylanase [Streptomyces sp. t39]TXS44869.1 endo-1,4-beta-xylanase [Streptomyces sp. t39]
MSRTTRALAVGAAAAGLLGTLALPAASAPAGTGRTARAASAAHEDVPGRTAQAGRTGRDTGAQTLGELGRRNGIRIGTAVDMAALADDAAYRDGVSAFSSVTAENVMKWQLVEPVRGTYDWAAADELVDFAGRNGQLVRGHTLVWHSQLPSWLDEDDFSAEELRELLRRHVTEQVRHFKGRIWQWDVVNEAFDDDGTLRDSIWLRKLGPGYIADAFRWAHRADPAARLYINDYNIEGVNAKSTALHGLVADLRREGVPVHGVGFQGHFAVQYGFPGDVTANLGRFDALGLETAVTEADVRVPMPADAAEREAQARGYSVLLQACLLTRRCTDFTVWGFTDKYSWVPGVFDGEGAANILDEDYAEKPAYRALLQDLRLAARRR